MRLPLATLPLSSFVKPASPSATLEHPPSPKKPSRLSMASNPSRTLLPSPFLDPSSAADRPGPLGTLFEVPPSPRGMMLAEEAQLEEDEFPPTPPRRLLDAFIQSAHKSPGGSRTGSASGSTSGIGSSRSRTGSPAPQSPTRRRVLVEEEAPAWEFYEDAPETAVPLPTSPSPISAPASPSDSEMDELEDDPTKENTCPPLRHRSNSLVPQRSSVPSMPQVPESPALPSPRARPSLPTLSSAAPLLQDPLTTPPASATSTIFPSWSDDLTSMNASSFGEGVSSMAALEGRGSSGSLLPALAFSPRKRPSLGEAGGDGKRSRMDFGDE